MGLYNPAKDEVSTAVWEWLATSTDKRIGLATFLQELSDRTGTAEADILKKIQERGGVMKVVSRQG